MSNEFKFIIALVIFILGIFVIVKMSTDYDLEMTKNGYHYVPMCPGHWEKNKD